MTNKRARRLVEIVGERVRAEMLAHFRPDCCVATARVLTRVFERLGLESEDMPLAIAAFNQRWVELTKAAPAPTDPAALREWCTLTGAYSVGAVPGGVASSRGFNGHVACWVPRLSVLLDGSLGQMARPEEGIDLPESVLWALDARARARLFAGQAIARVVRGALVVFQRIADKSYRAGPDWQDESRGEEIVRRLVRAAKEGAEKWRTGNFRPIRSSGG